MTAKVRKVPPTLLNLLLVEMRDRDWKRTDRDDADALTWVRLRGGRQQRTGVTRKQLCSTAFSMRAFCRELDMLDKGRV